VPWILLALLLLGAAGVLLLRLGPWRDARGRGIIVAEYAPAADMYPALAAELLRRRSGWLAAEIVRFAVSGIVRIREHPTDPPAKRYELILVDPDAAPLQSDERALLSALFGTADDLTPGAGVRLDTTDRPLGLRLVARKSDAAAVVASRGLRERPSRRLSRWLSLGLGVLAIASIAHLIISAANAGATGWTVLLDGVVFVASIVFFVLSFAPLRLTDAGAEQRDQLKGLRVYLELAEADRIRALQAPSTAERVDVTDRTAIIKLYEKLLPYAMIWGIEKQWIHELEQAYGTDAVPDWYFGNTSLIGLGAFSAAISTGSSSFGSSLATSSGSSSFGGSGGGGFSGGGGGGGGGGGW
jgi:Predicted membrane protein